jgi:PilZ domain
MEPAPSPEHRLESRSNIFVMATVYAAGSPTPVRVRNMSQSGALVEATGLPPAGTSIRLSRGSLEVIGDIMWVDTNKAGLRFASPVRVADWLPVGKRGSSQQLIDELVHRARVGAAARTPSLEPFDQTNVSLADELSQLSCMLERAGEELASDSAVTMQHLAALQIIDGVTQSLAKLAAGAAVPAPSVQFSACGRLTRHEAQGAS